MSDDELPPTNPPRPLTSVGTLTVVLDKVEAMQKDLASLNKFVAERTATLPPPSRPSLAVKAAEGTSRVTKALMIATGVLSVAGQIVAIWKPAYAGPIIEALRLLASLGGGGG